MTAGNPSYANLDDFFRGHHAVDYDKQFVRAVIIHTNFAESYHSLLKRGLFGAFHHVSAEHLHRYVNEFSFRWNSRKESDGERTVRAVRATEGKRLCNRGITSWRSGCRAGSADYFREVGDGIVFGNITPGTEIIPEGDAEL